MTDIVEELWASDDASALTNRAAREIERLRTEKADLQERYDCNTAIMHARTEAMNRYAAELAASQAREAKLREFLTQANNNTKRAAELLAEKRPQLAESVFGWVVAIDEEIALPHDDTALKARLAQERERIAKVFEQKAHDYAREYGHGDMGSLSFGQGIGGEIKMDYYSDLLANASLIRAMGDKETT